jgi:hypothetical protein
MTLVEAAELVERIQRRAAVPRELEALQQARDALLVIVSEGFLSLTDRHAALKGQPAPEPWTRGQVRPPAEGASAAGAGVVADAGPDAIQRR